MLAYGLGCRAPAGEPSSRPPSAGAAAGRADSQEPTRLRAIYSSPTGGHSMLWVTKEAGFFEQNGLDVELELLRGNQLVLAALMAGEIDLAQNTGTSVIDAALASQNIVALGTFTDR